MSSLSFVFHQTGIPFSELFANFIGYNRTSQDQMFLSMAPLCNTVTIMLLELFTSKLKTGGHLIFSLVFLFSCASY